MVAAVCDYFSPAGKVEALAWSLAAALTERRYSAELELKKTGARCRTPARDTCGWTPQLWIIS